MNTTAPYTRPPAVAGTFYPADAATMHTTMSALFALADSALPEPAAAVVVPHAGWVYSGAVCAQTIAEVSVPDTVVLLCPNHTGRGERIAVYAAGAWRLPDGEIPIHDVLAASICDSVELATPDRLAHAGEHAIEVILPFLHRAAPALRIVPIVVGGIDEAGAIAFGEQLAAAITAHEQRTGESVMIVASSDMSHYLADAACREQDRLAIDAALTGSASTLYQTVVANEISMCGYLPVTTTLAYCAARQRAKPKLVAYATSGDAFGDRHRVVGYAGLIIR